MERDSKHCLQNKKPNLSLGLTLNKILKQNP